MAHKKQKRPKLNNEFTQAIQAKALKQQTFMDSFKKKYPQDSDMAKDVTDGN